MTSFIWQNKLQRSNDLRSRSKYVHELYNLLMIKYMNLTIMSERKRSRKQDKRDEIHTMAQ